MFRRNAIWGQFRHLLPRTTFVARRHFGRGPVSHQASSDAEYLYDGAASSEAPRSLFPIVDSSPGQQLLVLDTLQIEITDSIKTAQSHEKVSNLDTRLRLSHFLQAVFLGDYVSALSLLQIFRDRCLRNSAPDKSVNVYTTCFITLLTQVATRGKRPLLNQELTQVVAATQKMPKSVLRPQNEPHLKEIHALTFAVLLKTLQATSPRNRVEVVNLVLYIRDLQRGLNTETSAILQKVAHCDPSLVSQYNQVFQRNESIPETADEEYTVLEKGLDSLKDDNNALSLDALCQFIEKFSFDASQFTEGKEPPAKYYQIFDALPQMERDAFMDAYLRFNYKKQLLVEDASQNIYKSVSSHGKMVGFTSLHREWIKRWLEEATSLLKATLSTQGDLEKFAFVFTYLGVEHVSVLCLTHMLSATVPASHAKVYHLADLIGRSLKRELMLADKTVFSAKNQLLIFNHDHAIEFACAMLKVLIDTCRIPSSNGRLLHEQDGLGDYVFHHTYVKDKEEASNFVRYGSITVHPLISEHFRVYHELFHAGVYRLPMIHPPKQWTSPESGGYFATRLPLVKSSEPKVTGLFMSKAHETGQLASVYESVNALGACPWTINPHTLAVFNELMNKPTISRGLPSTLTPQTQENGPCPEASQFADEDAFREALAKWKYIELENAKNITASQNLLIYYRTVNKFANSFGKNGEVLYLPHTMDFRGRVYPAVSYLSHQAEDLVRSLMMFWHAKPLGPLGYDWLVYQVANLHSKQKMSMEQLKEFVEHNKSKIIQSSENSLTEDSWWLLGDNPWQVLALCHELKAIWLFPGPISEYKSRIPVHQDGSCNGLQHYAALGADLDAALAVNVLPHEEMQDVYTTVLKLVEKRILSDEGDGVPVDQKHASMAQPFMSRKLVKQTVMTAVYGVTPYGAMQQVKKRIDEALESRPESTQIPGKDRLQLASYISQHILGSILDLFAGAKLIQNWLVDNCLRCIQAYDTNDYPEHHHIDFFNGKHYRPMKWTTLSGFPVIQMYRKRAIRELVTPLQRIILNDDTKLAPIDIQRLKNGIAPNFIHSTDAIHLLMTCLGAKAENITFASVHDSFWTHPSEVEVLSKVIREEFARLHTSNVIGNLRLDMIHVNRNSFQLVWVDVDAEENSHFVHDLNCLRDSYDLDLKSGVKLKRFNAYLCHEISNNEPVLELVKRYKPQLLWEPSASSFPVVYNEGSTPQTTCKKKKISPKSHLPLLVPVQILEAPAVGTLDIHAVLQSKYFFS